MRNVLFTLLVLSFFSCKSQSGGDEAHFGPDAFEKGLQSESPQILDVRKATEFSSGHLKNALLADWTNKQQFFERIKYVDKDRPVYI